MQSTVKRPIKPGDKYRVSGDKNIWEVSHFIGNENSFVVREYAHEAYEDNHSKPNFTVINTTGGGANWNETELVD